jgi:hypothetical protein
MPPLNDQKDPTTDDAADDAAKNQDGAAGDKGAEGGADKSADKGGADDKGADKAAKGGNLFDGLDDDDDGGDDGKAASKADAKTDAKGDAADKAADKPGDKKTDDKASETEDEKRERLAADAAWRDRVADKMLAPLKDKLSAKKFEQRREQIINQLKRAKSIDDAIVSGMLAQEKLRAGLHKKIDPDASPEDQAAWRKENSIPDAPDQYAIPAVPGHTWSEADQPTIDAFRSAAHGVNLNQEQVNALVNWHVMEQQRVAEATDAALKRHDAEDREACYDQIRSEFGVREFKPHMAVFKRLIEDSDVFGEDNAEKIMGARYWDAEAGIWRRLTSIPGVARGLIGLALDRYGDVSMPSGDGTQKAGKSRLDEINAIMKTDFDRYYRENLADEAMEIQREIDRKEQRRARR